MGKPHRKPKFWYKVNWLPGYLIYQHPTDLHSVHKSLCTLRSNNNLEFRTVGLKRFTLLEETAREKLINAKAKEVDFIIADQPMNEKNQAKLACDLYTRTYSKKGKDFVERKLPQKDKDFFEPLNAYPIYKKTLENLIEKHGLLTPKGKNKKTISSKQTIRPFRYFGNSANYLENIVKVLEYSESFKKAKTIRDLTCGSALLSIFLAEKYPEKKIIASDINSDVINSLNFIKETDFDEIKKKYTEYYNFMFPSNSEGENLHTKFQTLLDKLNQESPTNYYLYIFLQNLSYTNINEDENGKYIANIKTTRPFKLSSALECLEKCKKIIEKNKIEFKTLAMEDALTQAEEGDFCFFSPPHQNDKTPLYPKNTIRKLTLTNAIQSLNDKNIPCLITYGDNCGRESSDLRTNVKLFRFSFIVLGGMKKQPKKLSIYASQTAVGSNESLTELNHYFENEANKNIHKSEKELTYLSSQITSIIENEIQKQKAVLELSQEILAEIKSQKDAFKTTLTPNEPSQALAKKTSISSLFSLFDRRMDEKFKQMNEKLDNSTRHFASLQKNFNHLKQCFSDRTQSEADIILPPAKRRRIS